MPATKLVTWLVEITKQIFSDFHEATIKIFMRWIHLAQSEDINDDFTGKKWYKLKKVKFKAHMNIWQFPIKIKTNDFEWQIVWWSLLVVMRQRIINNSKNQKNQPWLF